MDDVTDDFITTTASSDFPLASYWLYGLAGVMCLISILIGCGFACTQFCKACLFSYPKCQRGARSFKTNPVVMWLRRTRECLLGGRCRMDEDIDDNIVHPEVVIELEEASRTEVERSLEYFSPPPAYLEALSMPRPPNPLPSANPNYEIPSLFDMNHGNENPSVSDVNHNYEISSVSGENPNYEISSVSGETPNYEISSVSGENPNYEISSVSGETTNYEISSVSGENPNYEITPVSEVNLENDTNNASRENVNCEMSSVRSVNPHQEIISESNANSNHQIISPRNVNPNFEITSTPRLISDQEIYSAPSVDQISEISPEPIIVNSNHEIISVVSRENTHDEMNCVHVVGSSQEQGSTAPPSMSSNYGTTSEHSLNHNSETHSLPNVS